MSESDDRIERAILKVIGQPSPATVLAPLPPGAPPSSQAALRKCRSAWQRAFNAYLRDECEPDPDSVDRMLAAKEAAVAYCNAMPSLAGPDGIRDFITCAAFGILIGAIPAERSGQVLYAAQVALAALPSDRRGK